MKENEFLANSNFVSYGLHQFAFLSLFPFQFVPLYLLSFFGFSVEVVSFSRPAICSCPHPPLQQK